MNNQTTTNSTMTVYVTPDHDLDMVVSDVELIDLEAEVNDTDFDTMIDNMTAEQFDTFMSICFDDEDIHVELSGDEYANEVINSIGHFAAHYGEM